MKKLLKVILSIKFVEVLDKNKNGRIEWSEIKNATFDDWMTIVLEIVGRVEIINLITSYTL